MTNSNSLAQGTYLLSLLIVSIFSLYIFHIILNYCEKQFVNDNEFLLFLSLTDDAKVFTIISDYISCHKIIYVIKIPSNTY